MGQSVVAASCGRTQQQQQQQRRLLVSASWRLAAMQPPQWQQPACPCPQTSRLTLLLGQQGWRQVLLWVV
jgi:hypothetical protein